MIRSTAAKRPLFRFPFFLLQALSVFICVPLWPSPVAAQSPKRKELPRADRRWVDKTLKKMTLEEKLGQMVNVFYFGGFTSTESEEYKQLLDLVETKRVGGFTVRTRGTPLGVGRSQAYPTAALANQLQARARVPLLIAADFERGTAMRLEEGTVFPYAMGVAATGDPRDAYTMGRVTALEARAVGVHWVFAPVADVNNNPDNPIINTRSFGEDPRRVSEFVAQFVRGVEENGVLSCAKHFPGHGDTSVDSHVSLPLVTGGKPRFDAVELPPFRAAIAAGASTVMTAHLAVPAYEPDVNLPATLSPNLTTDLLRKEMGFDGLVVTDALDMGGVTTRYAPGDVAVRSVLAGADVLLVPPQIDAALAALKEAVASGRIPVARIDESVRRILQAKARLGLRKQRAVDLNALNSSFGRAEFVAAAQDISDRGATLLRNDHHLLPLAADKSQRVLLVNVAGDPDPVPGYDLEREVRRFAAAVQTVRIDTRFSRVEYAKLPEPDTYDVAVVALFVRVADRKNTVGLPEDQTALVNQLLASGKPLAVVSLGSPYLIEKFPQARTWLALFSTFEVSQRSAGRALFGQIAIGGQMPVTVPGVAAVGDGLRLSSSTPTTQGKN